VPVVVAQITESSWLFEQASHLLTPRIGALMLSSGELRQGTEKQCATIQRLRGWLSRLARSMNGFTPRFVKLGRDCVPILRRQMLPSEYLNMRLETVAQQRRGARSDCSAASRILPCTPYG